MDAPTESDISVVDCFCDHVGCGKRLDKLKSIWVWNEHFGCTRDHVQRAQANTNALASAASFKRSAFITTDHYEAKVERDIDLL